MVNMRYTSTVSVVLPTFNRANTLGKAIQSVLSQTYENLELIVVDDGSTDNTEEVVKGFADSRLRYVCHGENRGAGAARNTGIKIARGEYIACQDDDSEWLPEKLEKQIKAFEKALPNVGVVYSGAYAIDGEMRTYLPHPHLTQKEGYLHKQFLKGMFIVQPSVVIRKECFKAVGMYDEKLPSREDWDMWIRLSKYYDFKFIDEPLVNTYYSPETSHFDKISAARGLVFLLEKHGEEIKEVGRKLLSLYYVGCGLDLCRNEDSSHFAEGRSYLWKGIRLSPLNYKYVVLGILSLIGSAPLRSPLPYRLNEWLKKLEFWKMKTSQRD